MKVEQSAAKRAVLEKLLEQGMVLVTLDTRVEGVLVPDHLQGDPQLRLNLSYRFGLPMETSDEEVMATLTFSGVPYQCHLPWQSIYMLVSHATGQPFLFPADIPNDADPLGPPGGPPRGAAARAPGSEAPGAAPRGSASRPTTGAPQLKVISGTDTQGADTVSDGGASPTDDPPPSSPRRGHLRVVK